MFYRINLFYNVQQLEYRWVQTGSLTTESNISSLSWNLEGTRLLTGGELLQLWHQNITPFQEEHSKSFSLLLFNLYVTIICPFYLSTHDITLVFCHDNKIVYSDEDK